MLQNHVLLKENKEVCAVVVLVLSPPPPPPTVMFFSGLHNLFGIGTITVSKKLYVMVLHIFMCVLYSLEKLGQKSPASQKALTGNEIY